MPHSDRLRSIRPHDGSLLWEGAIDDDTAVSAAVARARAAQPGWAATTLDERLRIVRAYKTLVEEGTAAATSLKQQAERLAQTVGVFRLGTA